MLIDRVLRDLREARVAAGLSREHLAREVQSSATAIARLESNLLDDVGLVRLSELASVLGFEVSLGLHPIGDPVRDRAHLAIGARFQAMLSSAWHVADEALLPGSGGFRAWDKSLRLVGAQPRHLVGVDIETRVHDVQLLIRRTRLRERDGQADAILLVLADTQHNRRMVSQLRLALGRDYQTEPRVILAALRDGRRLPGSGVILL
jgi:transcriptional regulator with XRE-family HTH domain